MWVYDLIMLPFVLLYHVGKALFFIAIALVILFGAWLFFFA